MSRADAKAQGFKSVSCPYVLPKDRKILDAEIERMRAEGLVAAVVMTDDEVQIWRPIDDLSTRRTDMRRLVTDQGSRWVGRNRRALK